MLTGKIHDLRDLGFSHLKRKDTTFTNAVIMNMPHDLCGRLTIFVKKSLENMHDEFHGRVIVIQEQYAIEAGLLCLRASLGDDHGAAADTIVALIPTRHP